MYFMVSPQSLEYAKNNMHDFGVSVLMELAKVNNSKKVCYDNNQYIKERYKQVILSDSNAILLDWLNYLDINKKIKYVSIENNPDSNFLDVSKNIFEYLYCNRNYITTSPENCVNVFKDMDVNIFTPQESIDFFDNESIKDFCYNKLIFDTFRAIEEMSVKQREHRIEDLHNDILVSKLRNKDCYLVEEQVREGQSQGEGTGELDFIVKNRRGMRKSIFEALRSNSCDINLAEHFNKLLNRYDTLGLKINFLIVYIENDRYDEYCTRYDNFMQNINEHANFEVNKTKQIKYVKTSENLYKDFTDIRIAKSVIERQSKQIEVIHILANFSSSVFVDDR